MILYQVVVDGVVLGKPHGATKITARHASKDAAGNQSGTLTVTYNFGSTCLKIKKIVTES